MLYAKGVGCVDGESSVYGILALGTVEMNWFMVARASLKAWPHDREKHTKSAI